MDLTDAIAYSNNYYFANLGIKLGYERMNYYAHLFGYGEKAGLNVEGEQPGYFPPCAAEERRDGYADQLWRRDFADTARIGCADGCDRQWRHTLLAAISAIAGRSEPLSSRR